MSHIFFSKHKPSITELGVHGIGSANYRHVVDLGDLDSSVFIIDTGVSESRLSDHHFDLNEKSIGNDMSWIPMIMGEHNAAKTAKYKANFKKASQKVAERVEQPK